MKTTIGKLWDAADGRPAGFDDLRILLSTAVILWHTLRVCYGEDIETWFWLGPMRPLVYFIVPAFFALSGFLVAGSLLRNDLLSFASLRIIRIFPALVVEVVVSALVIGLAFTTLDPLSYFGDVEFRTYFLNVFGIIHYDLPGVFLDNPGGRFVNLQLWTVPYELDCYLVLGLLALARLHRRPMLFLGATLALTAAVVVHGITRDALPVLDARPLGRMILLCFLFGVFLFLARDRLPMGPGPALAALVAYSVLIYDPVGIFLSPFFVAYATVAIGLWNHRLPGVGRLADYSYGMYLYGFPLQQVVAAVFPDHRVWWFNFAVSFVLALLLAMASWHFVEAKVAARKKPILAWIHRVLRRPRLAARSAG